MKVSKPSTLALLLLLGVSAGWAFLQVLRSNDSAAPELSWQSAPFILLFAFLMLMVKRRINVLLMEARSFPVSTLALHSFNFPT